MSSPFQAPEFWESHYRSGDAPWELPRVPGHLSRWIEAHRTSGAVLIPGCGSGREISMFTAAGWNVTAIDFSATAIDRARANAGAAHATFILDDFLTHPFDSGSFDLIYERTFLTALSPDLWPACAERYRNLLKPAGQIAGYCLYGYGSNSPPFFQPPDQPAVFAHGFELVEDAVSEDALPIFGERERWQVWRGRV